MLYTPMTVSAMKLAYDAHHEQLDKGGVPYIFHPFHLAEQMEDELTCTAALLHDVVEDTNITLETLETMFPPEVTEAVRLLTHEKGVPQMEYLAALAPNPIARKVKLADIAHNDSEDRASAGAPLSAETRARLHNKYTHAREFLMTFEDK